MMQFHNILKETPKYESCIEDSLSYWQMFHHKTDIYCGHQSYHQERSQILSLETLKCHLGTLILIWNYTTNPFIYDGDVAADESNNPFVTLTHCRRSFNYFCGFIVASTVHCPQPLWIRMWTFAIIVTITIIKNHHRHHHHHHHHQQ